LPTERTYTSSSGEQCHRSIISLCFASASRCHSRNPETCGWFASLVCRLSPNSQFQKTEMLVV
jgi:hypothetical protein